MDQEMLDTYRAQRDIISLAIASERDADDAMRELLDSLTQMISLLEDHDAELCSSRTERASTYLTTISKSFILVPTTVVYVNVSDLKELPAHVFCTRFSDAKVLNCKRNLVHQQMDQQNDQETSSSTKVVNNADVDSGFSKDSDQSTAEEPNHDLSDMSGVEQDLVDSLQHMQCRVPFQHEWGQLVYSNAMVQSVESTPMSDDVEEVYVRVLFMQPTHRKMAACKFFLDGRCRFEDKQCHFSHGEVYPLSKLKPYEPPDFSNLKPGSRVLCQNDEGIWERGKVVEIHEGNDENELPLTVLVDGHSQPREIRLEQIIPEYSDENLNEGSAEELDERRNESDDCDLDFVPHAAWSLPVSQVGTDFGVWESHTKGIGSKLMSKMGFLVGQGLGSRPGGRTEPVTAQVFPKGRSLDFCMELREQKNFPKVGETVRRTRHHPKEKSVTERRRRKDVFSVINSQMVIHQKKCLDDAESFLSKPATPKSSTSKNNVKDQNIELIKLQDRISTLGKDLTRLRSALIRNQASDRAAAAVIAEKINVRETEIAAAKKKYDLALQEQSRQKDKKAITVF